MDYEKAYKAVLKTATQWIKDGCTDKEKVCLECVFPELRESEDERVAKAIDEIMKLSSTWGIAARYGLTAGDIRRWVKKQKEQKPAEKQDYSGMNDLERAILRGFLAAGVENVPVGIIKDTASECMGFLALIEPKPAEWSEEDERMLSRCEKSIESSKQFADSDTFKKAKDNEIDWLENRFKSLRPSWKPSEEHLSALLAIFNDPDNIGSQTCQLALADLYEQLKKL